MSFLFIAAVGGTSSVYYVSVGGRRAFFFVTSCLTCSSGAGLLNRLEQSPLFLFHPLESSDSKAMEAITATRSFLLEYPKTIAVVTLTGNVLASRVFI